MRRMAGMVVLLVGLTGLDQLSKFSLATVLLNREGAFSLPISNWGMIAAAVFVLLMLGWHWHSRRALIIPLVSGTPPKAVADYRLPITFILAGGLSNLSDRIFFEGVRDIFWLYDASFNLADLYVIVGVLFFTLIAILPYKRHFITSH